MDIKCYMVIIIVSDGVVHGSFDKVMGLHLDDVREYVSTLEHQVFNHEVE